MAAPGVCQYCKVTDDQVDGNKLSWHDASRTCCSKYACVKKFHMPKRVPRPMPTFKQRVAELVARGWGLGAAYDEVRSQERRAKRSRGKGKAA